MIWRIYIYGMVTVLALATIGSFAYLTLDPPARLARTAYGLNRFTTPQVILPTTAGQEAAAAPRTITVDALIRAYQRNATGADSHDHVGHNAPLASRGC
ncbi:MAG: hypothetical protein P8180_08275 [Gammaproteobacteria bacterium]|jgi:hypothetical protein